jgi:hypothetical protein
MVAPAKRSSIGDVARRANGGGRLSGRGGKLRCGRDKVARTNHLPERPIAAVHVRSAQAGWCWRCSSRGCPGLNVDECNLVVLHARCRANRWRCRVAGVRGERTCKLKTKAKLARWDWFEASGEEEAEDFLERGERLPRPPPLWDRVESERTVAIHSQLGLPAGPRYKCRLGQPRLSCRSCPTRGRHDLRAGRRRRDAHRTRL